MDYAPILIDITKNVRLYRDAITKKRFDEAKEYEAELIKLSNYLPQATEWFRKTHEPR